MSRFISGDLVRVVLPYSSLIRVVCAGFAFLLLAGLAESRWQWVRWG